MVENDYFSAVVVRSLALFVYVQFQHVCQTQLQSYLFACIRICQTLCLFIAFRLAHLLVSQRTLERPQFCFLCTQYSPTYRRCGCCCCCCRRRTRRQLLDLYRPNSIFARLVCYCDVMCANTFIRFKHANLIFFLLYDHNNNNNISMFVTTPRMTVCLLFPSLVLVFCVFSIYRWCLGAFDFPSYPQIVWYAR